jgi:hypothetical protein
MNVLKQEDRVKKGNISREYCISASALLTLVQDRQKLKRMLRQYTKVSCADI